MRKTISILTNCLLVLIAPVQPWWAFCLYFWANSPGSVLMWGLLLATLAPPAILFRRLIGKSWSNADVVLAGIAAVPGILAVVQVQLSRSHFQPWTICPLAIYAVILGGAIYLRCNPDQDRTALLDMRPETEEEFVSCYETMFAERGEFTPSDPLEFHLYHLARYWSRLVGFCRIMPGSPEIFADGAMGIAIRVANRFMDPLVGASPALVASWNSYKQLSERVLQRRVVLLNDVEAASEAFDRLLATASYDPWFDSPHRHSGPVRMEDLVDKGIPDNAI